MSVPRPPSLPLCTALLLSAVAAAQQGPFFGNGVKIGEATTTSSLVWVRLTSAAEPLHDGVAFPQRKPGEPQLPEGRELHEMAGAVPGAPGSVRVRYRAVGSDTRIRETLWTSVDADSDYCHTFRLADLKPGTRYELIVQARSPRAVENAPTNDLVASFRTAPEPSAPYAASFCVVTGQDYPRRDRGADGHAIYGHMLELDPDFFVHTGDTLYYDKAKPFAPNVELARFKWNRLYGLRLQRAFHERVATWFMKDDHDTLKNDCWPGQRYGELTWEQGLAIYREQLPVGTRPYRRQRYGRHLEVWFLEGREFRSPNRASDGPDKTILGEQQRRWLEETLRASGATFRVVVSATPIVGPDRKNKNDNHANRGFRTEGDWLRALLGSQPGTIVVCGDRHWQYVSHDPTTGLREWSCGPTSDKHAGGFRQRDRTEQHDFLKICGGFLHVAVVSGEDGARPTLRLRHHAVDGSINHEDVLDAPDGR